MSEDSGSDGTPGRKKRPKKALAVSETSDSEDAEDTVRIRKRLRVLSEDESTDSSGSSVPASRRGRRPPQLGDYEDEAAGDSSDWASDCGGEPDGRGGAAGAGPSGCASDSSEGNSDKCPICLLRFSNQEVGTPQSCEHIFCFDCITEWSKNVNTCPVDRSSFESIVVRTHAGGRVLRTVAVQVVQRRPSVELMVEEDPTNCEVCGRADSEESMLLCDGCDLGYHLQCLEPPLQEIPLGQWFCTNCSQRSEEDFVFISEVEDLLHDMRDIVRPNGRASRLRQLPEEPSTSSGRTIRNNTESGSSSRAPARRTATAAPKQRRRRKTKRRRTRTVIVEYEIKDGGKFPVKKKVPVKRRVKKRKIKKRQPRTAARRSLVRASVRERLASLRSLMTEVGNRDHVNTLASKRHGAGIPSLSLFGTRHQLEYFSDDEETEGGGGMVAVATRPSTSSLFSALRQARRKNMISNQSPPRASAGPDLLSSIMDSQTRLHSKKSLVSISVDGKVDIKLQVSSKERSINRKTKEINGVIIENPVKDNEKVNLTNGDDAAKKAPSYPGHSRGGGWNGGYRGGYNREGNSNSRDYSNNNSYNSGNYGTNGGYGRGSFQNSQGNFQNSSWQDEQQNFPERRFQDDNYFDRQRTSDNQFDRQNNQRPLLGRGRGYSRSFSDQGRQSLAPNWQPYEPDESNQRIAGTPSMARHSFGGFEEGMDALDMRVGQNNINEPVEAAMDLYGDIEAPRREDTPPQHYEPLPEPPVFRFEQPEGEKSEDERSDSGLVIDTEKYDPMEPTNDESSGDEGPSRRMFPNFPELPPRPPELSPIKVSAGVLNTAVQQVLKERNFFGNKSIVDYKSDDESDGDCPNFSIYSATSVNIANSSGIVPECSNKQEEYMENVEDLVQEDDDIPLPEEPSIQPISQPDFKKPEENISKEKTAQDEYEERLSRRCPITPNKRNPIKIKLNSTPTLIKRHVLDLYEDEEEEEEEDQDSNVPEKPIEKTPAKTDSTTHNDNLPNEKDQSPKKRTLSENYQSDDETSKKSDSEAVNEKTVDSEKTEEIKAKPISDDNNDDEKVKEIEKETKVHDDIFDTDIDDGKSSEQKRDPIPENTGDDLEKMTESISESEDERSYTPCLDENKSKDTSLENEKDISGIEGLDTEMISEDEGNEMFSEPDEKHISDHEGSVASLPKELTPGEDGEIVDKTIELEKPPEGEKKKKKKDKKVLKTKGKGKKSGEVAFKKLSKSGKERNYRDKEEKGKTKSKPKKSDDKENKEREKKDKKKEKRKDLERYDVRNIVSEKRRRVKDVFGRDLDSRPHSKSPSLPPSLSAGCRSISRPRRSISAPRRTLSRGRRSISRIQRSVSNRYTPSLGRSPLGRRSISRGRQLSLSPRKSLSPRMRKSTSPRGNSPRLRRSMDQPRAIPPRLGLSISPHHRSISPKRRSISPRRRTNSTRGRRSISLRIRRSVSQRPRRSISPRVRQSISPRERRSFSPRARRSFSPRTRRSNSPRINKPISPRFRRSLSHKRRKSVSPKRRKIRRSVSPKNRKSVSRSRKRVRRSISPKPRKSKSPRKKRRSRSKLRSVSRIRSRSPKPKKSRRTKARKSRSPKRKSPKPKKRKSRSVTPELMLSPERIRDRVPPVWRNDKAMYQAWSDTRSINSRLISPSWTPPREPSPDPRSLRVFLTNTEKPKRKEKKRRQREAERLRRIPDGPSKEVFTSGNNILVSVSFNKDDQSKQATELGKKRKRKGESKKDRRDKMKRRRGDKRQDTENNKPVAIIDLEKSPFRELTPSPKNIIVLSDSDHAEKEEELVERQQVLRSELHDVPTITQETNLPIHRELPFINSVGPKTPPEPTVKFSIMTKTTTQLRVVNPLHEEEELDQTEEAENQENDRLKEGTHKGPNTPPDPPNTPPSSPDAYDPFEPTKSGSATPEQETAQNGEEIVVVQEKNTITLETAQKTNLSADDVVNQRPITPIEKVMALLQSTRNVSPTNVTDDMGMDQPMESESASNAGPNTNGNQSPGTNSVVTNKSAPQSHFSVNVAPTVSSSAPIYLSTGIARIGAFSNAPSPRANSGIQLTLNQRIVLPSPTKSSPLKSQPTKLFLAKPSPIKSTPIKPMPSKTIISKLPLPNVKPIPGVRKKNNRSALNDIIDLDMDLDSPYSPGSSDFGDLFEPPSDGNIKSYSKSGKGDIFDSLFGGNKSKKSKSSAMKVPVKQIKKKGKTQVGVKMDEDNLKILDDLPSSAVEMQVKSKFLKKLNRQERVVEEVKHVLKPHYNKKHVTKEQYKDILRKAVPKICHNKHGEINPAKIQSLIEAYVRKFRKRNKS